MRIHNWRRVGAGIFHDFHTTWLSHIKESLNSGLLPDGFYALAEQQTGDFGPDVVALHWGFQDLSGSPPYEPANGFDADRDGGMVAVAEAPPRVQLAVEAGEETVYYFAKRRSVVIRHSSNDRVVAILEVVSPANKHSPERVHEFCEKVVTALKEGVHVLVIDLLAIGLELIDMPLFLTPTHDVSVPLATTYEQAAGVPQRWRAVIETSS